MAKLKTFTDGEVLTAADVNAYLVNDPDLYNNGQAELRSMIDAGFTPSINEIEVLKTRVETMENGYNAIMPELQNLVLWPPAGKISFRKVSVISYYDYKRVATFGLPDDVHVSFVDTTEASPHQYNVKVAIDPPAKIIGFVVYAQGNNTEKYVNSAILEFTNRGTNNLAQCGLVNAVSEISRLCGASNTRFDIYLFVVEPA